LIDKEGAPASPVAQKKPKDVADDMTAARMAGKLGDLQEVASQHDFKFLHYVLDIARAEAERLDHQHPLNDNRDPHDTD